MSQRRYKFKLFIDRALSQSIIMQILILLITLAILLGVSFVLLMCSRSAWVDFCNDKQLSPWLLPLFLLIDTNALNSIYISGSKGGMLLSCTIIYVLGLVVCSGMLIGVITNYIGDRVYKYRNGMRHYVKSGHCVIMGYDDMVPSIINEIFSKMLEADVVLLTALNAEIVTEKLSRSVARKDMERIFITYGHRTVKDYYKDIHLEAAEKIYIVGNRTRPDHDAVNVECIDSIRTYLNESQSEHKPQRITCVFEDLDTYAAFKTTEIFSDIKEMGIDFIPYNFYTGWARQVFVKRTYKEKSNPDKELEYPSVYGEGIVPEDKRFVHLVFVGTSNFSVSFAMEAAHLMHFPNFEKDKSLKTRITFIDFNADEELRLFSTRNRHFFEVQPYYYLDTTAEIISKTNIDYYYAYTNNNPQKDLLSNDLEKTGFLDVEFEFIKGDAYSANVQMLIRQWAKEKERQYLSIFLAMSNQRDNFIMGMNMPDEVYDNEVPVFIRQDRADNFVTNLRDADSDLRTDMGGKVKYYSIEGGMLSGKVRNGRYANIYPFGMDDMAYFTDEDAFIRAKLINCLYCRGFPDINTIPDDDDIWKDAHAAWNELKVSERWSNLYAAYSIRSKLDTLRAMRHLVKEDDRYDKQEIAGYELNCIAAVEHNRWNVEKLLFGYRKAKPTEDRYIHEKYDEKWKSNKKNYFIHSDIRPFEDLDNVKDLDVMIVKFIPWIIDMAEKKKKDDQ